MTVRPGPFFAFLLLPLFLASCQAPSDRQLAGDGLELEILHVNDTHSVMAGFDKSGRPCDDAEKCRGGYARIASMIKKAKQERDNVIALHAGDDFQGTLFFTVNKWPMLAAVDNSIPFDAMTPGNHEYDLGCEELKKYVAALPYPVLAANLTPGPDCPLKDAPFAPYVILEIRGEKVGIIGLSNRDEVMTMVAPCDDTAFADTKAALKNAVADLETQGVKHIIALTHLGLYKDLELARSTEGVDVIVGGHTHSYLGPDSKIGPYPMEEKSPSGKKVLVVTAAFATQYVGDLKLKFDQNGDIADFYGRPVPVDRGTGRDPETEAKISAYAATLKSFRAVRIGSHALSLPDGMAACRTGDCLSGMLTTDAMLSYAKPYGAQIALCNSGTFRAPLSPGDITRGDVMTVIPFTNDILLRRIKGSDIIAALENGAAAEGTVGPHLLHAAGLSYTVNANAPKGARVSDVMLHSDGGSAPPDPEAFYSVAVNSFIGNGGDGFDMLRDGENIPLPVCALEEAVEEYLASHDPLPEPTGPRLNLIPEN